MRISGFSMVRNATLLYYPIRQAIESILPIVDEFVVAVGKGDEGDRTRAEIDAIGSPRVRVIDTVWDTAAYPNGTENAHQTDIARAACTGDWLFYLQADEVVHEKYLPVIERRCRQLLDDRAVEGLLFHYLHFWGDYWHMLSHGGWYPREIRIVRNDPNIHSWESAQSFRYIPDFDGRSYRKREGTRKLRVASVDAYVYHYGWCRPPDRMNRKRAHLGAVHRGEQYKAELAKTEPADFDYGPLRLTRPFRDTHPAVMKDWIAAFDWGDQLREGGPVPTTRGPFKHEQLRYRLRGRLERNLLGGREIGGFRNYELLRR